MKQIEKNLLNQKIVDNKGNVPHLHFQSDAFKCNTCNLITHLKILGNSTGCVRSECNGTMYRMG
jgi:hypothetical protein